MIAGPSSPGAGPRLYQPGALKSEGTSRVPSGLASSCTSEASTPIAGIRIWTGGEALGAVAPTGEGSPLEPTSAGTTEGATCRMLAGDEVGGLVAGEADRVVAAPPHPVLTARASARRAAPLS